MLSRLRGQAAAKHLSAIRSLSGSTSSDAYCVELVKKHDFENYLCGLLLPADSRAAYFAIRAFNVELATVRDQINSNAMAGRIRFQWWRDVLKDIVESDGEQARQQPVALALKRHIREKSLSLHWFERSIDARQRDLTNSQPETIADLEDYAEQGHSSVLYLILEALGVRDQDSEYTASHIGVCSGISTLLRGFPHHAAQGSIYIPKDIMTENKLDLKTFRMGPKSPEQSKALKDCVFEMASQAYGHLDKARALNYTGRSTYALLPAVRASMFLEKLRKADFDIYDSDLHDESSPLRLQMNLLYTSIRKKI